MNLSDFDFNLPSELIAQFPPSKRGEDRLLIDAPNGDITDCAFSDFPCFLQSGDVMVINNTRVIKARLFGQKSTGGHVEVLIERVLEHNCALSHIRSSKSPKEGTTLIFEGAIHAQCLGRMGELFVLKFQEDVYQLLEQFGHLPLPPYIERSARHEDDERYQTIFAHERGAVAAPTAGLHFTDKILQTLRNQGVQIVEITLHVGAGTFQPVRVEHISEHKMHHERYFVPQQVVDTIENAKARGNKVCAVGTTSLRALESAALSGTLKAGGGDTDIFITPGFTFHTADLLLTNFHLPKSTLLMLVSAFAGYSRIQQLYQHAITHQYHFFSYGDSMLLTRR